MKCGNKTRKAPGLLLGLIFIMTLVSPVLASNVATEPPKPVNNIISDGIKVLKQDTGSLSVTFMHFQGNYRAISNTLMV